MSEVDKEFFPTPAKLAALLVEVLSWKIKIPSNPMILEPSAGTGAFIPFLAAIEGSTVLGIDPNFDAPTSIPDNVEWAKMSLEDLKLELGDTRPFDVICGNPPFSLAEQHLRLLLTMGGARGGGIGFLLRLGFLASKGRKEFFGAYPPKHVFCLPDRPSFMWCYTCTNTECLHKEYVLPKTKVPACPACNSPKPTKVQTDSYDYGFFIWEFGQKPGVETTLSWLNRYTEKTT